MKIRDPFTGRPKQKKLEHLVTFTFKTRRYLQRRAWRYFRILGKQNPPIYRDTIVTEVSAICTYLADEFPKARLNIPVGDPRRGIYLKWLFFGPSVLEPAVSDRAFPRKEPPRPGAIGWRDLDQVADVIAKALTPGPYILGGQFTAADVVIGSGVRWGTMFKLVPNRPEFAPYIARIAERPAVKRAEAKDKSLAAT